METVVTDSSKTAASFILNGGIVAFPTETVFGLGANVYDESAIRKVFEAKGRPSDNPLIVHISGLQQLTDLSSEIRDYARDLIGAFFPGPLTIVVKKSSAIPGIATAGLDTIGIRMPDDPLAREFIERSGGPVVAPSANISGKPSPTTWQAVYEDLNGKIDCILKGGDTEHGLESTVIDCTGDFPVVLRRGAVSSEEIQKVVPNAVLESVSVGASPKSPGLKHKHYAPSATVVIFSEESLSRHPKPHGFIGLHRPPATFENECVCPSPKAFAQSLFEFFRDCDRKGIKTIFCEQVEEKGIGAALMDRIRRASE